MSVAKYILVKKNKTSGEVYTAYERSDEQLASHLIAYNSDKFTIISITNPHVS